VIGQPLQAVLAGWPVLDIEQGAGREIVLDHAGEEACYYVQSSQIRTGDGAPAGYTLVLFDITARKHAERQLERLARTDPLTGTINRRSFFELAEAEWSRAQRYGRRPAVVMFDIDHFKQVNDRYGHQAGDAVLKHVADLCQKQMRAGDLFARYGGEEFICLVCEGEREAAAILAERLREIVERSQAVFGTQTISVTVSLGVAYVPGEGGQGLTELISCADRMLYQSKADGRNRVTVATSCDTMTH
jgi:diguanylate cyclase (GGDEF)-like protein